MSERSRTEGLLAWKPAMASTSPRLCNEFRTVNELSESFVTRKRGQVSRTQLKPIDTIRFEIASTGCLLSPSATIGSRWDTQFTHDSFTLCPVSSTIHREFVESGSAWFKCVCKVMKRIRKENLKNTVMDLEVLTTGFGKK